MSDGFVWFEGIPFPVVDFTPEHMREVQENFVFKDEDVLTLSFPKSDKGAGSNTETHFSYVPYPFSRQMKCFLYARQRAMLWGIELCRNTMYFQRKGFS